MTDSDLNKINWVIVGSETGPKARPIRAEWVRVIRDKCVSQRVSFFFKQWSSRHPESGRNIGKKKAGRVRDDRTWDEIPLSVGN